MKKLITLAAALSLGICAYAAGGYKQVNVLLSDNSKLTIVLTSEMKITFDDTYMSVTGTDSDVKIERSRLVSFTHDLSTGVGSVTADGAIGMDGDRLLLGNLPEGSMVRIFDMSGATVKEIPASGSTEIRLNDLQKGAYIVNINGISHKIMVK